MNLGAAATFREEPCDAQCRMSAEMRRSHLTGKSETSQQLFTHRKFRKHDMEFRYLTGARHIHKIYVRVCRISIIMKYHHRLKVNLVIIENNIIHSRLQALDRAHDRRLCARTHLHMIIIFISIRLLNNFPCARRCLLTCVKRAVFN
jgi:hypothetical protein